MGNVQTAIEDEPSPERGYTLAVAVANPAHADQLMRTAVDIAAARGGQIRVVTAIHKPVNSPFLLFSEERIKREFADGRQAVLDEAVAAVEDHSVPVQRDLVVGADVSEAIHSLIDDVDADALLLGWQDRSRPSDIVLGTTVDPLVRRAPCDVFVERVGTTADEVERILLPTDGGPHIDAATEIAGAIARANAATVRIVSYVSPTAGDAEREIARGHVDHAADRLPGVSRVTEVREEELVEDAIVSAGTTHDLVVLGATREHRLRNRVVGSVARDVGKRATVPIVIAKRRTDGSLLERAREWLKATQGSLQR